MDESYTFQEHTDSKATKFLKYGKSVKPVSPIKTLGSVTLAISHILLLTDALVHYLTIKSKFKLS